MLDAILEDEAHVPGEDVIPSLDPCGGLGQRGQRQGGAGACPLQNAGIGSGALAECDDVLDDIVLDIDSLSLPADLHHLRPADYLPHLVGAHTALFAAHHFNGVGMIGIADGEAQHKPVHLGIRQHLGAFGAGGVLRGDDDEGLGHRIGVVVDRDLALLHRLQQGGLGAAVGPVQLVRQEEVAEHSALLIAHLAAVFIVDGKARDVRGQHVRRKLDTVIVQAKCFGEGHCHGGLSHTGNVLHQNVAACDHRQQHLDQHIVLADNGLADLAHDLLGFSYGIDGSHRNLLYCSWSACLF